MRSDDQDGEYTWRASPASEFVWICFDDDYVVFHRPSGKTHLLNPESQQLLTEVLREPRRIDEIARYFDAGGEDADPETKTKIGSILRHLESLGLVRRAP